MDRSPAAPISKAASYCVVASLFEGVPLPLKEMQDTGNTRNPVSAATAGFVGRWLTEIPGFFRQPRYGAFFKTSGRKTLSTSNRANVPVWQMGTTMRLSVGNRTISYPAQVASTHLRPALPPFWMNNSELGSHKPPKSRIKSTFRQKSGCFR